MQKNLNVAMGNLSRVKEVSTHPFSALFGDHFGNRAEYRCEADSLEKAVKECHVVVDKYPQTLLGMGESVYLCFISQRHSSGNSSVVYTEPKEYQTPSYRGVPDTHYIWNGTQSDPEILYSGKSFCYWDVEDSLWELFKEDTGVEDVDDWAESRFQSWVDQNHETVIGVLEDLIAVQERK